ncbi:RNA polymerase factor sigma-54 [bacterium]|nr:RNA polymerase factor sigma-54 [bacterium]
MAFEPKMGLTQGLRQSLVITPQLKQAIKILQLAQVDLAQLMAEEAEQNPTLEVLDAGEEEVDVEAGAATAEERMQELHDPTAEDQPPAGDESAAEIAPESSTLGEINWEEYLSDWAANSTQGSMSAGGGSDWDEDRRPSVENTLSRASTLADHLTWQLRMGEFAPEERAIGDILVGNADDNGYLRLSLEDAAFEAGADVGTVERVLARMQEFEPAGVLARDLRECLLIQLRQRGEGEGVAASIVRDHLQLLEAKRFDRLARELGVEPDEVARASALIASLEPKPGRDFASQDVRYVVPDVFVEKMDGEWVVLLNDDGMPRLRVSNAYRRMLSDEDGSAEAKNYIREKLSAAQWLIRSIQQRQSTLFKVTSSIVRFQRDFLDQGVKALRPLRLKDVAEDIGMHESTVSRATANKWVHTPQGTLELKYFFTSSIRSSDGDDLSAESVKEQIRGIIEAEDPRKPFSDQHIAQVLAGSNVEIARRTVAKYREIMGILPSSKRRQLA